MHLFTNWSKREYPLPQRLFATALAGVLLGFLIPYSLLILIPRWDAALGLPRFSFGAMNVVVGILLILVGLYYGFWSVATQIIDAHGTPLPVMPTQRLLVSGPFKQCRNPMAFGTMLAYLGVCVLAGSWLSVGVVLLLMALLTTYIKRIEERELVARFGEAYLAYRDSTPFIIPRIFPR